MKKQAKTGIKYLQHKINNRFFGTEILKISKKKTNNLTKIVMDISKEVMDSHFTEEDTPVVNKHT